MSSAHEPGYPEPLVTNAKRVKAVLQMAVGLYAIYWLVRAFLFTRGVHTCVATEAHPVSTTPKFCYMIPPAIVVFQIIADALAAATVIQLAFTLFTPGPDEALDPVLLAIATVLLFQLGNATLRWQDGLAVLFYATALGSLFVVRVFVAPDEDSPPRLWWWTQRRPRRPQYLEIPPVSLSDQTFRRKR